MESPTWRKLPFILMRGGTSKGAYFLKEHLPSSTEGISRVLLTVLGTIQPSPVDDSRHQRRLLSYPSKSGECHTLREETLKDYVDPKQTSGIGGGTSVTSKVAILSRSEIDGVDIDYQFAQVGQRPCGTKFKNMVDVEPSCGNILSGVGPAAIEMGLIDKIGPVQTVVKIRAINNNSFVDAIIQTPKGEVSYEGHVAIDGVKGTAEKVVLNFMNVVGSKSNGRLLPTDNVRDVFEGIEVTCIDVAMPMVIARASSFGKSGYERKEELDEDKVFFEKLEAVRILAGKAMGLGDVRGRVIPKFAIVAEPEEEMIQKVDASITARYFVPDNTHPAMAVTGAICLSACSILEGSVAYDISRKTMEDGKNKVVIAHPSGSIQVLLGCEQKGCDGRIHVKSAGIIRTARYIGIGFLRVPSHWWNLDEDKESIKHYDEMQSRIDEVYGNIRALFRPELAKKSDRGENGSAKESAAGAKTALSFDQRLV